MASLASPLGSDFVMMGQPVIAADTQSAPGYPAVNTSVNASGNYGAALSIGNPTVAFIALVVLGLVIYHWDSR